MKNEEIEHDEELETLYHQIATIVLRKDRHSDEAIALLAQAIREAKIEALEEAIRAATQHEDTCGHGCGNHIAYDIRALKDSLLETPVEV